MTRLTPANETQLGKGRSGVVYRAVAPDGKPMARKVFGAAGLTKFVQYALLGAPNPYQWSQPAVCCAVLRRRILDVLVREWFDGELRVAAAVAQQWNTQHHGYEIQCELIDGRHVQLHHPYTDPHPGEMQHLRDRIMKPLQCRLADAGFDGLVWQAGLGNPVAMNNFMREHDAPHAWVWIDLESGVPAVFAINPIDLGGYYIPRAIHHGAPMFDDVDIPKLRACIERMELPSLRDDVDCLERAQREWKSQPRHQRSIAYRLSQGDITPDVEARYQDDAMGWYLREAHVNALPLLRRAARRVGKMINAVARFDYLHAAGFCWGMLSSQKFRTRMARSYVDSRIAAWQNRGQLTETDGDDLRARLEGAEASRYITDFGVHLGVKPLVKPIQYGLIAPAIAAGLLDVYVGSFLLVAGGALIRTLYTLGRIAQNAVKGRELPWIALLVGVMPVIGNLAFPLQIIFTSAHENAKVAQFIVYDTFSRLGEMLPIWGGRDTLTEHTTNRLPDVLMRHRLAAAAEAEPITPRA